MDCWTFPIPLLLKISSKPHSVCSGICAIYSTPRASTAPPSPHLTLIRNNLYRLFMPVTLRNVFLLSQFQFMFCISDFQLFIAITIAPTVIVISIFILCFGVRTRFFLLLSIDFEISRIFPYCRIFFSKSIFPFDPR